MIEEENEEPETTTKSVKPSGGERDKEDKFDEPSPPGRNSPLASDDTHAEEYIGCKAEEPAGGVIRMGEIVDWTTTRITTPSFATPSSTLRLKM